MNATNRRWTRTQQSLDKNATNRRWTRTQPTVAGQERNQPSLDMIATNRRWTRTQQSLDKNATVAGQQRNHRWTTTQPSLDMNATFSRHECSSGALYSCSNCHQSDCSSLDAMEAVIGHLRHSDQCHRYYRDFRHPGPRQQAQARPKGNWEEEEEWGWRPINQRAAARTDATDANRKPARTPYAINRSQPVTDVDVEDNDLFLKVGPPHTDACPNRTTNGCRPAVFNMVWGPCTAPQPSLEIHCDRCRPTGQENTAVPLRLDPRGLEQSVTPLPTNHWGINPCCCAHTPSAQAQHCCYGTHLWDSFPRPAAVICSGPGSRDKRGTEGLG
ncbi:hypothetical protein D9C73_024722 [Collichthys lucidus]|uniref:Uncharacterized protein n=1 Tax=Collichthys lucidus TaxID=240159 RepID=A0A4U5VQC1_COLLU|nr:hypothetical protein D9C73_024722 [Collichthys lucidus]